MTTETMVVTTNGGVIGAHDASGILFFKGIPFAAPPVGEHRFQPPQPHEAWIAPREATEYGPTAPQLNGDGPLADMLPNVIIRGDDYLNLNVWTPSTDGALPVMVFLHGGAFVTGSGAVPAYDGSAFARDGVVLVTINYRLGADGFLWFGDGIPNLGMLDQVAALEWVRDNIAAFGGNPGDVTIFGESAGAMSVCTLVAMPRAKGLFRRAIAESGAGNSVISAETAKIIARRIAAVLGVEPTREAVAAVPVEDLLAAGAKVAGEIGFRASPRKWGDVARNLMPYEPVVDGDILPAVPLEAMRDGAASGVQILIGTNVEEARLFIVPSGVHESAPGITPYLIAHGYQANPFRAARTYRRNRPGASAGDVAAAIMTDWYYRIPAIRVAEAVPGTHVYDFAWRSSAFDGALGAAHALEIPFVFDGIEHEDFKALLGHPAPDSLASAMHRAWVDFAKTGDPGWPAYTAESRVSMRFDETSRVTTDDRADERLLWKHR